MKEKMISLVKAICSQTATDCRGLCFKDLARELMNLAEIPTDANIQEIPLCWNNQVVVCYLLPNDNTYYELFAGMGLDNRLHFEISKTGELNGKYFNFYDKSVLLKNLLK